MRVHSVRAIVALAIVSLFFGVANTHVQAQTDCVLLEDDFDGYTTGPPPVPPWSEFYAGAPWQPIYTREEAAALGISIHVDDQVYFAGGKSVHFLDTTGSVGSHIKRSFAPATSYVLEYYMRTHNGDYEGAFATLMGDAGEDWQVAFSNGAYGGHAGYIGVHGSPQGWIQPELLAYQLDTWYYVRRTLDLSTNTGNFYVEEVGNPSNNASRDIGANPNHQNTYIDGITVWSSWSQRADCYIDELKITSLKRIYETDFASDPGWMTNNPARYYWDSSDGTFSVDQVNINNGGEYAYYDVNRDPGSFQLEWDIKMLSNDYASGVTFGLFDTGLDANNKGSFAHVSFINEDRGRVIYMSARDSQGAIFSDNLASQFSYNTWYHVLLHYDATALTLTADVTVRDTGEHFTSLQVANVAPFEADMDRIGTSNVREGSYQVPGAHSRGRIDNVRFSLPTCQDLGDAYYPFNGNADDESGNGHHGTVNGATLIPDKCGNPDKAYGFDGDDYIVVDNPPSVTTAATFMAWVRMEQGGLRVGGAVLVKGVWLTRQTYMIAVNESDLTPTVNVHIGGTEYVAASSEALSFGEWTHIAGVYDGNGPGLTIYVNGESKGNQAVTGALEQNSADLYFGCDFGNSLSYWEGGIDEVRIYDEALTQAEIQAFLSSVLYVDDHAPSGGDGSTEHPFDTIQEAINAACDGDTVIVRDGTYTGDGNRDLDFGGKPITVRSENGPENCIIDCQGGPGDPHRGFIFQNSEDENSIVDGFTIANGWVDSPSDGLGGGILCLSSSPVIMNNTIKDNVAKFKGGGVFCEDSSPRITSNSIIGNTGQYDGGGICASNNSSPIIANNTITGNRSLSLDGGGIICWYNTSGTPATIVNNIVTGNISGNNGGGIECYNAAPVIVNNTIIANSAADNGGGVHCQYSANATVKNSIIRDNNASAGANLALSFSSSHPSSLTVSYSDVEGGEPGVYVGSECTLNWGDGNIDADPLFANAAGGDYHLKSQEGRWDPAGAVWAPDGETSPCIDAGDPASDFADEPEPNGGRINMGAYGNTPEASKSYQEPVADGSLIIEGPDQRGEEPALMGEGTFTVDVHAEGIAGFAAVQAVLEFANPLGADDAFRISMHDGNPEFGGQAIVYNEALFGSVFPVYVANVGRPFYRQTAGFMMSSGSADLSDKTWLMSITYDYSIDFGSVGTHTITANELLTVLAGGGGGIPHDVVPGSVTFLKWPIPGDANFDCVINVIDMLVIRDKLNADVTSGDNWRADVNEDGAIDILDLIFVRNNLHDICASMASAPKRE